jgi:hypothetical protein
VLQIAAHCKPKDDEARIGTDCGRVVEIQQFVEVVRG